ncbi:MAG: hypothetical protein IAE77_25180 [Prosthecobacter sp.]|jgi:hypothetical protein|uniref:hypothetical protein n=1 Tax=Prosthecobacter sp. TaxID=1965333 RepID=UPI0019F1DC14|nr:hypothetical protein [Prosthecobacter sp.]MBE2286775.1 hypothetical protein [Prosthecobacter sp.]
MILERPPEVHLPQGFPQELIETKLLPALEAVVDAWRHEVGHALSATNLALTSLHIMDNVPGTPLEGRPLPYSIHGMCGKRPFLACGTVRYAPAARRGGWACLPTCTLTFQKSPEAGHEICKSTAFPANIFSLEALRQRLEHAAWRVQFLGGLVRTHKLIPLKNHDWQERCHRYEERLKTAQDEEERLRTAWDHLSQRSAGRDEG